MKTRNILLIICLACLAAGPALADQMIVQLKSGNTVIIDYQGSINGVTMQGESDGIVGMQLHRSKSTPAASIPETMTKEKPEATPALSRPEVQKKDNHSGSAVRIKWARPIDDENLKNARSPSREGWFGSK